MSDKSGFTGWAVNSLIIQIVIVLLLGVAAHGGNITNTEVENTFTAGADQYLNIVNDSHINQTDIDALSNPQINNPLLQLFELAFNLPYYFGLMVTFVGNAIGAWFALPGLFFGFGGYLMSINQVIPGVILLIFASITVLWQLITLQKIISMILRR